MKGLHSLIQVGAGRPLRYATFREAWQELHFSLIYEVCVGAPAPSLHPRESAFDDTISHPFTFAVHSPAAYHACSRCPHIVSSPSFWPQCQAMHTPAAVRECSGSSARRALAQGCHDRADFTAYVQSLLAAACDHLIWPLPPEQPGQQPGQAGPQTSGGAGERSPGAKAGAQRGGRRCGGMLPSAARGRGRGRSGGRQPAMAAGPSQQQPEAGCGDGSPQAAQAPGSSGQAGQLQAEPEAADSQPASAAARSRVMDRAALMALLLEDDEGDHAPLPPPGGRPSPYMLFNRPCSWACTRPCVFWCRPKQPLSIQLAG